MLVKEARESASDGELVSVAGGRRLPDRRG